MGSPELIDTKERGEQIDVFGKYQPNIKICTSELEAPIGSDPSNDELRNQAEDALLDVFDTLLNENRIQGYTIEKWDTDFGSKTGLPDDDAHNSQCNDYESDSDILDAWTNYRENHDMTDRGSWLLIMDCGTVDRDSQGANNPASASGWLGDAWILDASCYIDAKDIRYDYPNNPTEVFKRISAHEVLHTFIKGSTSDENILGDCDYVRDLMNCFSTASCFHHDLAWAYEDSDGDLTVPSIMNGPNCNGATDGECAQLDDCLQDQPGLKMSPCTKDAMGFSARHVNHTEMDSFNDGDMDEYEIKNNVSVGVVDLSTVPGGDPPSRNHDNDPIPPKAKGLEIINDESVEESYISIQDGSNDLGGYPSRDLDGSNDQMFRYWVQVDEADSYADFVWAWSGDTISGSNSSGYQVTINVADDVFGLKRTENGSTTDKAKANIDQGLSVDTWYDVRVQFLGDKIAVDIFDTNNEHLGGVENNDEVFTDGRVGWGLFAASQSNEVAHFDHARFVSQ